MVISGFQIILQECLYCANGQNIETKQKQCRLLYELPLINIHDEEREREREVGRILFSKVSFTEHLQQLFLK